MQRAKRVIAELPARPRIAVAPTPVLTRRIDVRSKGGLVKTHCKIGPSCAWLLMCLGSIISPCQAAPCWSANKEAIRCLQGVSHKESFEGSGHFRSGDFNGCNFEITVEYDVRRPDGSWEKVDYGSKCRPRAECAGSQCRFSECVRNVEEACAQTVENVEVRATPNIGASTQTLQEDGSDHPKTNKDGCEVGSIRAADACAALKAKDPAKGSKCAAQHTLAFAQCSTNGKWIDPPVLSDAK